MVVNPEDALGTLTISWGYVEFLGLVRRRAKSLRQDWHVHFDTMEPYILTQES